MMSDSLSPETIEILEDSEFERAIKYVAMDLGASTTLADVKKRIEERKPPRTRDVDGKTYIAGYSGAFIIVPGKHVMQLVEIDTKPKTIKFMFANSKGRFVYHTVSKDDISVSLAIEIT